VELYPAIDLRGGRCVRLRQGDYSAETVYADDPVAVAKSYEAAGARWVHVVDLDAARREGSNRDAVVAIASAVSARVQAGGGVRDGALLAEGVARVVLGSLAAEQPDAAEALVRSCPPGAVAIGIDHWGGEVRVAGWEAGSGKRVGELVARFADAGAAAFVVTDISRDGLLGGPDVDGYGRLVASTDVPVVASGGVGSLDDLRSLARTGVAGVIVGRALYEGRFTVEEALAACAA
jgi:phosphoribosylformimino-5-aminoimidazole carboxamide ribotide isomerase